MADVVKTLVVLVIFIVLLRGKIFLGTVMALGSLCLAILYRTPLFDFLAGLQTAYSCSARGSYPYIFTP